MNTVKLATIYEALDVQGKGPMLAVLTALCRKRFSSVKDLVE